ncbi:hypothetical protein [Sporosarcina sp. BP05]|uniref:hypothetical protein n=1 Tax=Sporosarcina sp. BP05 TaxID=2758726 RepID=UPI001647D2C8|nr:hypothetical protein [Sporosarcina sp. BP05]
MTGYLTRKKSKGNTYIYLRKSKRVEGEIKHDYIYSFGKMPAALNHMYSIVNDEIPFPSKLDGYDIKQIFDWIWCKRQVELNTFC